MEVWRPEVVEGRRPEVLSGRTVLVAVSIHLVFFAIFWGIAVIHGLFEPKETVIPIDLTIVVNENLDGNEEEPPPLANPDPEPPPPPKPKVTVKTPDPPKPLEQIVTNVVKKIDKKKPDPPKEIAKKEDPPKVPDPPKKTDKQLREERLAKIRNSAVKNTKPVKIVVDNHPSGNGRTDKQIMSEKEIRDSLLAGYVPGRSNQLAESEKQLGASLVQRALQEKWETMAPKVGASGDVLMSCRFNSSGGLIDVRIETSCGDRLSDAAALSVARGVTHIRNLPAGFLNQYKKEPLPIRYHVKGM